MSGLMSTFIRALHSIICCRILLNLRRAATPKGPSTILESITLQFATAPGQETNHDETIQFDTRGARDDEEESCQQPDEEFVEGHS